jgi:hypothetical protein
VWVALAGWRRSPMNGKVSVEEAGVVSGLAAPTGTPYKRGTAAGAAREGIWRLDGVLRLLAAGTGAVSAVGYLSRLPAPGDPLDSAHPWAWPGSSMADTAPCSSRCSARCRSAS